MIGARRDRRAEIPFNVVSPRARALLFARYSFVWMPPLALLRPRGGVNALIRVIHTLESICAAAIRIFSSSCLPCVRTPHRS
eukprot:6241-Pleurochrysis_carterae.AAC.2